MAARAIGNPPRQIRSTLATHYALNQWQALLPYGAAALRAAAFGPKNFLLMGAESGGKGAASMYTLITTAKLNGIDPEGYGTSPLHI